MSREDFTAKTPSDDPVPLLIGLVGPSSSGKTYSALELGTGIAEVMGGDIHVIDTEAGRSRHYRKDFKFKHVEFGKPYSSARYLAAIEAQVKQGASVVIIDSMSHEHEGAGGYLEFHEAELDRLAGDDWKKRANCNFLAWAKPAAERRALISGLTSLNAVFIFCFRAKEKVIIRKGQDPIDGGWMPIAGDEFVYEMTMRALLPPGSNGVPLWKPERIGEASVPKLPGQFRDLFKPGQPLTRQHGAALARWAKGGATAKDTAPAQRSAGPSDNQPSQQTDGPTLKLALVDKDGTRHELSADKWESTLTGIFTRKPFDTARNTWELNKDYIGDADDVDPERAARVRAAWEKREAQAKADA